MGLRHANRGRHAGARVIQYLDSKRDPMERVCASSNDVFDSLVTIYRARVVDFDPRDVDFESLHSDVRELGRAANKDGPDDTRRAASSARQQLVLVTSKSYAPIAEGDVLTPAAHSLTDGAKDLQAIRAECKRRDFAISDPPRGDYRAFPSDTGSALLKERALASGMHGRPAIRRLRMKMPSG
jgi:hypothetical protein